MKELYNWHDVAKRTEIVYDRALKCSKQSLLKRLSRCAFILILRLQKYVMGYSRFANHLIFGSFFFFLNRHRYLSCGAWAGKLFCLVMIIDFIFWHLLQRWQVVKLFHLSLKVPDSFFLPYSNHLPYIVHQPAKDIEEVPDFVLSHDQDDGIPLDKKNQNFR